MKIYTGYLIYEDERDWPEVGEIYVSLDPQNRLGPQTWIVAIMGDGISEGDTTQLGLFWRVGIAVNMAQFYNNNPEELSRRTAKNHVSRTKGSNQSYSNEKPL